MGRPKKTPASLATKLHPIVGVKQIMPDTNPLWAVLLKKLQRTARSYGFNRIELPIVDEAKVYEKYATASGLTVDAATLNLNDDVAVSLRSSLLPSLFSAYASFHKADAEPTLHKWLSIGNVMRPIPGGLDSDYQFVFEVLGHFNHLTEAQTIGAVWKFVSDLGLEGLSLEINTIGAEDCQKSYQAILGDFLKQKKFSLCDNCNEDLRIRPFNVLRCTNPDCQEVVSTAPIVLDYLDQNSHKHFTYILEALDELQVPYQLNSLYVGPSGSSHTNVVIKYRHKDQVVIIGEGAYHSEIVSGFGIKNNDAFGFLVSLSALYNCLETQSIEVLQEYQTEVFLVPPEQRRQIPLAGLRRQYARSPLDLGPRPRKG
jgi:histidyl-tRNA synthetase